MWYSLMKSGRNFQKVSRQLVLAREQWLIKVSRWLLFLAQFTFAHVKVTSGHIHSENRNYDVTRENVSCRFSENNLLFSAHEVIYLNGYWPRSEVNVFTSVCRSFCHSMYLGSGLYPSMYVCRGWVDSSIHRGVDRGSGMWFWHRPFQNHVLNKNLPRWHLSTFLE